MDFSVKIVYKEDFYPTYKEWCEARKFPPIAIRQIDTVFVCYKEGLPIYSCFFWTTNSTFGVIGFPVGNPNIPYKDREGGLEYLFNEMINIAERSGYEILWTTSDTGSVIDNLKKTGFKTADRNVDQYYKRL